MNFCSPVSQLLVASSFFPHKGQDRGDTAALPTQPLCPERDLAGTRVAEGIPAPECSTPIYTLIPNAKLEPDSTTWAKQTHTFLCHDPPTRRVWEGRKKESTTWCNCLLLFTVRNLRLLCSRARVFGFVPLLKQNCSVRILKQPLRVTSYPCGKKASILMMGDEMTQYCQNKKSLGDNWLSPGFEYFSWCCLWVNIQA